MHQLSMCQINSLLALAQLVKKVILILLQEMTSLLVITRSKKMCRVSELPSIRRTLMSFVNKFREVETRTISEQLRKLWKICLLKELSGMLILRRVMPLSKQKLICSREA